MKKQSEENICKEAEKFYIHFDVKEHCISVDDFVRTIQSTKIITNSLASLMLENPKLVDVYVYPPENGSLLVVLGIAAKAILQGAATGVGIKFLSKEAEAFIEELSGYKNGDLGKNAAKVLKDCVQNFVEKSTENILKIQNGVDEIDIALKAKNDFFDMCSKNKEIKGIGFTKDAAFPIKRNQFAYRMTGDIVKPIPIKEELKEMVIVKPVNVDEDLQWDFKDKNTHEAITAKMADEYFKNLLMEGKCPLRKNNTPDVIIAKVEFHKKLENGKEKKDAYIVTDVYKFNKKLIKAMPDNMKLNRLKQQSTGQLNFFDGNKIL